jgi:hypothetical protein
MDTDTRVLILQQKLSESKMHPAERDALANDLQFANEINGDSDPIKQMLKTITIQGVRRELLAHDRQARHYSDCPIAKMITEEGGKKIMPWEKADKALVVNDGGSITGWGVTLKGPVARLAIASVAIIAVVWLMLNRQDATLRKDMRETILPSVMQAIQLQTTKGDTK